MTREEFGILVKAMNATYVMNSRAFIPDKEAFEVWFGMLSDLPYELASASLKKHMQTSRNLPTVADIRNGAVDLTSAGISEGEAWGLVSKAVRRSAYNSDEEFEKLPAPVRRAVGTPQNLFYWSQVPHDELETVIHSNFLRSYRAIEKREREEKTVSPEIAALIQKTLAGLEDKMGEGSATELR